MADLRNCKKRDLVFLDKLAMGKHNWFSFPNITWGEDYLMISFALAFSKFIYLTVTITTKPYI